MCRAIYSFFTNYETWQRTLHHLRNVFSVPYVLLRHEQLSRELTLNTKQGVLRHSEGCTEIAGIYFQISSWVWELIPTRTWHFLIVWVSVMISKQEGHLPWYTKDFIYCTPEKREVLISHSASQLPHRSRLYICYIEGASLESEQETITPRPGNEWMCVNTKGHSLAKSVILNPFSLRKYIFELLREFLGLQRYSVWLHITHKHTEAWQVPPTFINY